MNKNNKNTKNKEQNNIKNYIIAFFSIIAVILISVYFMSFFSSNKKVKVTENQITSSASDNQKEDSNNNSKPQANLKTAASEAEYEKISTDFINVITSLAGNDTIIPNYNNRDGFYELIRNRQCNMANSYLSENLAARYNCEKLPSVSNSPVYLSNLITSKIEDIKVKSKTKLDDETFRFTYYIKIKFNSETIANHGEGSDGSTMKLLTTKEFDDVYVDVKNNKIFKTNVDDVMKNATILWNGKNYLDFDWQIEK